MKAPVVFIIFKRPDTTEKVFEAIRRAKPSKLFVIADGHREGHEGEAEKCAATQAIIDRVDWDCEVFKNYSSINLGCAKRVASGLDWVFEHVEEAIILEDDCIPHPTFFRFCEEMLEYYRFDNRISSISAQNFAQGKYHTDYSYYFSRYPHCWGWATWKRAWQYFDFEMSQWPLVKREQLLHHILQDPRATKVWMRSFEATYTGQINSWGYRWVLSCWLQGSLSIHPNIHLVTNIGFAEEATNTSRNFFPKIHLEAMQFPLKHPPFIVRDTHIDQYLQRNIYDANYLQRVRFKLEQLLGVEFTLPRERAPTTALSTKG